MMTDEQQITLNFVHPTDSGKVLTATVGGASTPDYLISQLVRSDFLTKPGTGAQYKLVDTKTGKELADQTTLAAAGVAPNATLNVLHSVTGARRR
jgi:predicted RecB family nuclease